MSVRKRVLVSGKICWVVDYRDQEGKRRARQFPTQRAAVSYETKIQAEIVAGTHVPDLASATIEQAGRALAAAMQAGRVGSRHTAELQAASQSAYPTAYRRRHEACQADQAGHRKLPRQACRDTLTGLSEQGADQPEEPSLRRTEARTGRAERRHGLQGEGGIAARNERSDPRENEIRAMVNKTSELWPVTSPWRPLIVTAIFTGLRASELRGLDLEACRPRSAHHPGPGARRLSVRVGQPKKPTAGRRDVPLAPMVVNTLRQWRLACPKSELGLVFPTRRGRVVGHSSMRQMWRRLLRALELPRYRFHDLRHAAASLFIEQGLQPKKVQTIMGHGSIKMTFDLYGHLWETAEDDQAAMAQIEARILGSHKS